MLLPLISQLFPDLCAGLLMFTFTILLTCSVPSEPSLLFPSYNHALTGAEGLKSQVQGLQRGDPLTFLNLRGAYASQVNMGHSDPSTVTHLQ